MSKYKNFRFTTISIAIENIEKDQEVADELIELCRHEFKKRPMPGWHCCSMLQARGRMDIINEALSLANDR